MTKIQKVNAIQELSRKVDELSREVRELRQEVRTSSRTEAVGSWSDRQCARCGGPSLFGETLCRNCTYAVSQESQRAMC